MFEDIAKDIKAQLYEKARSPLAATFIGAWLVVNIRTVLVFFSELNVNEKIAYFDKVYPTFLDWILHSLAYPLGSAFLVLLIYPHLARAAYQYWQIQYLKVKDIQQKLEDKTPLTQEEAKALRKAAIEQQILLESQLSSSATRNAELQKQIDELVRQLSDVRSERSTLIESLSEKDSKIESLRIKENEIQNETRNNIDNPYKESTTLNSHVPSGGSESEPKLIGSFTLPRDVENSLKSRGLSDSVIRLFVYIVQQGGEINKIRFLDDLDTPEKLQMQHAINQLVNNHFVYTSNSGKVVLNDDGLAIAVDSGLVNALNISR